MSTKKVMSIHEPHAPHMVGDGLPVRNLFSYRDLGKDKLSPFLLLDYGSPSNFPPTDKVLGVGMHPHRGFETVTLVFQGGLEHRDSAGNFGEIGPGDVQWMTAGKGVLHEELHSAAFRKSGGTLQMVQLWVNLPAEHKMTAPKYQTLLSEAIPVWNSEDDSASVRVVAGTYNELVGPARTFTPVHLFDVEFHRSGNVSIPVKSGYTTALFIMHGKVTVGDTTLENGIHLAILDRENPTVEITASGKAHLLVLNGAPIDEPVVGYGPFVMNSEGEIAQAMRDFQSGRFASV